MCCDNVNRLGLGKFNKMSASFVFPNPFVLSSSTMTLSILICSSILLLSSANIEHYSSQTTDAGFRFKNSFSLSDTTQRKENVENVNEFSSLILSSRPRRRKRTTLHSLCERECDCTEKNHFVSVECNLTKNQQYIFGSKNYIPKGTTSLVVKLAPKASLRIETDFFKQTKVNRISIIGQTEINKIHVEFRTNSSANSLAPNPEIEIRNCHTLILRENSISGDIKLNIKNCNDVIIFENALYATKFVGVIDEVRDLRIAQHAFYKAYGNLRVFRSYIENIYRFDAFFNQIGFYNCTIGNVTGKTFDVIQISAIIFDNCRIKVINTEAMSEKLLSNNLKITGGYIGTIESQAIYGVGIRELVLSNNHIEVIQSNAIKVTAANASITNNRILRVGLEWLCISDWDNVIVSNNTFGEFNLMLLDTKNNQSMKCLFEKNLITNARPGSLNLTNRNCIIREVAFDHVCKCLDYDNWLEELTSRDIRSESYCRVDEQLQFCFNRTQLNVLKYENEVCSDSSETLDCMKQNNLKIIDGQFISREELESGRSQHFLLALILAVALIVTVACCIVFTIMCYKRRRNSIMAQSFSRNLVLDSRSRFSKEDAGVINQTMDMVRQRYPHVYDQLETNVKELSRTDIDDAQCVERIGAILQIIDRCENLGDGFVAFNAILNRLLEPVDQNPENHLYAEPQPNNVPQGHTEIEHIYSEPHSVQLPLLTNEYMTPADKNDAPPPVYAEPFSNNKEKNVISPYATPNNNTKMYVPQQPSISNKKQMGHVQKIAENFSNNPNFHITKSPNTNRRIPQYATSTKTKVPPAPSQTRAEVSPSTLETRSNHSGGSNETVKIGDID